LQLRYLQTLTEIAVEKNSTLIFPFPIDLVRPFIDMGYSNINRESIIPTPTPAGSPASSPTNGPAGRQRFDPLTGKPMD
jgi:hypothetical protein